MRLATDCPWLGALHKCQVAKENCEQELVNVKAAANSTSPALEDCRRRNDDLLQAQFKPAAVDDDPGLAASLQSKVDELTTRLEAAEGDLSRERSAEAKRVSSMGTEDSATQKLVWELQAKQDELSVEQSKNEELKRNLEDAKQEATHLKNENRLLTEARDKRNKEDDKCQATQKKVDDLTDKNMKLTADLASWKEEFNKVAGKRNEANTLVDTCKEEAATCKKEVTDLRLQKDKLTSENVQLTESQNKIREDLKKSATDLKEEGKAKKEAETKATTAANKADDVASKLLTANKEVESLKLKVTNLESDVRDLRRSLETSTTSLTKCGSKLKETKERLTEEENAYKQIKAFVKAIPAAALLVTTPDQVRTWRVYDKLNKPHHFDDNLRSSLRSAIRALDQLPDDALPAADYTAAEAGLNAKGDLSKNWQAAMEKFWPKPPEAGKMCCKEKEKESYVGNYGVCWSPWRKSELFAFFKVTGTTDETDTDVFNDPACVEEDERRKQRKEKGEPPPIAEPLQFEGFEVGPDCKKTASGEAGDTSEADAIVAAACDFKSTGQMLRLLDCCRSDGGNIVKSEAVSVSTAVSAASIRGRGGKKIKKVPRPNGTSTMGPVGRFFHRAHDFFHPA